MDMFQLAGLDDLLRVRTIIIWNVVQMSSLPTLASSPLNLVAIRDQEKNRIKELLSQVLDGESFHCRSREKSA